MLHFHPALLHLPAYADTCSTFYSIPPCPTQAHLVLVPFPMHIISFGDKNLASA